MSPTSGEPISVARPPIDVVPHHGQRSAPSTRVSSAASGAPRRRDDRELDLADGGVQPRGGPEEGAGPRLGPRPGARAATARGLRGSRLRCTSPTSSRPSTSRRLRALADDGGGQPGGQRPRPWDHRAAGRSGAAVHGPRSVSSRPTTPSASRAATSSSRASSRAGGRPPGSGPTRLPSRDDGGERSAAAHGRGRPTASGRPCGSASTTTATGRPRTGAARLRR